MGWITINDEVTYYSVAQEIGYAVLNIIKFLLNIQYPIYIMGIMILIGSIIVYIMIAIRNTIKRPIR